MIEKVNPSHPDKVADRIAGAIVDLAYNKQDNPKVAVEFIQWPGGTHWYAKIRREDIVDACGNQKWNTRMEAMQAAKWYLETYYDYYEN